MNWRTIVVVFMILSLAGLLFFSKTKTKDYVGFFKEKVGKFTEVLKSAGEPDIRVVMNCDKDTLDDHRINLLDSTLSGEFSIGFLSVDGKKIEVKQPRMEIYAESLNGKIYVDENGVFSINAKATSVEVGDFIFSAEPNSTIEVEIEAVPLTFTLTGIQNSFDLENVKGMVKLENGKFTANLHGEKVKLSNFVGDLKLDGDELTFDGNVDSVEIKNEKTISIY